MKKHQLASEPSEREIIKQSTVLYANFYNLLVDMRNYCQLSIKRGASLLKIERARLRGYENQRMDMTQENYCIYLSTYYLYIKSNHIDIPVEIDAICQLLMREQPKEAES